MVEKHFLADQFVTFKNKNQHTRYFRSFPGRFKACPHSTLCPSEPALDDNRIVSVMNRSLLQIEVGERRHKAAHQPADRLRSVRDYAKRGTSYLGRRNVATVAGRRIVVTASASICAFTIVSRRDRMALGGVAAIGPPQTVPSISIQ